MGLGLKLGVLVRGAIASSGTLKQDGLKSRGSLVGSIVCLVSPYSHYHQFSPVGSAALPYCHTAQAWPKLTRGDHGPPSGTKWAW